MSARVWVAFLVAGPLQTWSQPVVDHHQHLFSPSVAERSRSLAPISAADLVQLLDEAGIARAVVLSLGYQFGSPNAPPSDEYAQVRAENDWTSREVASFSDRLIGFCSLNPLRDYVLTELERCASNPNLRTGIKLHFGNSDVDLSNAEHVEAVRTVFAAANANDMAIVLHLRTSISLRRPYGADQARVFLEEIISAAPNVAIQVAHLAGAGGYDDPTTDEALSVFVEAIARGDSRMNRVYFDVSGVAGIGDWETKADLLARRIRQLGLDRVLFGSDGAVPGNRPAEAWSSFRKLPLSEVELDVIRGNVAPYLQ